MYSVVAESVKVFFSKKVKKIDKIFTTYLTLTHCQIGSENFVNYYGLLGKQELYLEHHMTQQQDEEADKLCFVLLSLNLKAFGSTEQQLSSLTSLEENEGTKHEQTQGLH